MFKTSRRRVQKRDGSARHHTMYGRPQELDILSVACVTEISRVNSDSTSQYSSSEPCGRGMSSHADRCLTLSSVSPLESLQTRCTAEYILACIGPRSIILREMARGQSPSGTRDANKSHVVAGGRLAYGKKAKTRLGRGPIRDPLNSNLSRA